MTNNYFRMEKQCNSTLGITLLYRFLSTFCVPQEELGLKRPFEFDYILFVSTMNLETLSKSTFPPDIIVTTFFP